MSGGNDIFRSIQTVKEAIQYLRTYFNINGGFDLAAARDINAAAEAIARILSFDAPPVLDVSVLGGSGAGADEALNRLNGWLEGVEYARRDIKSRMPAVQRDILDAVEGKADVMAVFRLGPTDRVETRPDIIMDIVRGKNVIHLGCTDHISLIDEKIKTGTFFHMQLMEAAAKCLGVDINAEAVEYLKERGFDNILCGDITEPGIAEITRGNWDYIVLGEVIEHVDNPVAFLKAISANYKQNVRRLIITAPNTLCLQNVFNAYTHGIEAINADHKYGFTPYTLCNAAYKAGLVPENMRMCTYGAINDFVKTNYDDLLAKPVLLETIVLEGRL